MQVWACARANASVSWLFLPIWLIRMNERKSRRSCGGCQIDERSYGTYTLHVLYCICYMGLRLHTAYANGPTIQQQRSIWVCQEEPAGFLTLHSIGILCVFGPFSRNPAWCDRHNTISTSIHAHCVAHTRQMRWGSRWMGTSHGIIYMCWMVLDVISKIRVRSKSMNDNPFLVVDTWNSKPVLFFFCVCGPYAMLGCRKYYCYKLWLGAVGPGPTSLCRTQSHTQIVNAKKTHAKHTFIQYQNRTERL